jgi:hypothetical protein
VTRRELARRIGGALAWIAMGRSVHAWAPRRYGAVTIERHRLLMARGIYLHVYHRGVDVTNRCRFADDTGEGIAELFLHDAKGRPYLDPLAPPVPWRERRPAKEIVYGVTLQEGAPFR